MDPNVITALASVQAEIGGIEKLTAAERQRRGQGGGDTGISYAYRGIDQIAAAAQPLFGEHGIVIVPQVASRETTEIMVRDKPWSDTIVLVNWSIYGPGGVEDCITATTEGWGRDNSDKGINKAMTGAYKNLLLRLLTIGDPQDDTDGHTSERDAPAAPVDPERQAASDVFRSIRDLGADDKATFSQWINSLDEHPKVTPDALTEHPEWRETVRKKVEEITSGFVADDPNDPLETVQPELLPA